MAAITDITSCIPQADLAETVGRGCGANVCKCYQCKKCSTGCPVAAYAEMHPAQIMRAIQLGQVDLALDDKFIWLCTGCQTCTTRCPQGIDVAAVMDELKIIARREDRIPAGAALADVLRLNADSIKRWGRLYEVELMTRAMLNRPRDMAGYVPIGRKMMAKRKIRLLPERGDRAAMKRMISLSEDLMNRNPTTLEQGRRRRQQRDESEQGGGPAGA
jgi:heterodisulfide reductase subunit C